MQDQGPHIATVTTALCGAVGLIATNQSGPVTVALALILAAFVIALTREWRH